MKKLVLKEVQVLSHKERAAKKVVFDPRRTIIHGKNGTGKSSLIKTILMTFGANPKKVHSDWKKLNPTSLVKFDVDGVNYSILKNEGYYAVFEEDVLIKICKSVTKELGPVFASILDFKLQLTDRNGDNIVPPPAYVFLPFYIDQDTGWTDAYNSFSNLTQFKDSVNSSLYYHTGIRPNEYYETKGEIDKVVEELKKIDDELALTKELANNIKEELSNAEFNIDIDDFKEEVKELLVECEGLKKVEEKHKRKLVDLYNQVFTVEAQIEIAKHSLNEASKDYQYANKKVEHSVECPTCGAEYENSFVERFEIAKDTDRCRELISELYGEKLSIESKIDKQNESLNETLEEIQKIEVILKKKKGDLVLGDIIENAGRNELRVIFNDKIEQINALKQKMLLKQNELDILLKGITNANKKKEIITRYEVVLRKSIRELEVLGISADIYKNIYPKVMNTGSSLPRTLISYYHSIFSVINKYSSSVLCPLIIDSPNQQAQDFDHIGTILNFINENQVNDTQLILGLEELYDVDFKCKKVTLCNKGHLLQNDEYDEVYYDLESYIMQVNNSTNKLF